MAEQTEWRQKTKVWTYLIMAMLLVVIVVVINVVWKNPVRAEAGIKHFLGLPGWALASITAVVGILVFWGGLKVEPEWPEAFGAFLVAGAIAWFELIVGWNRFDLGGMVVIPYLIPLVVFLLMLAYALKRGV
ncbi:MAG: hypothetical protein JWO36_1474 [Myxococcales bacterium]|nr:hypothetical protein [Myxococcales bacterium]